MKCYHVVSNYHVGSNAIMWDQCYHVGSNVIMWDEMLSCGMNCYHVG